MKTKIGIIGIRSYTGGELLRLLLQHPNVEVISATSTQEEGVMVTDYHQDIWGETNLVSTQSLTGKEDIVFICSGHGTSAQVLESLPKGFSGKIIDLGNDFRLKNNAKTKLGDFVYGIPELHQEIIQQASYVANPGCFATAINLALLPLAKHQLLNDSIHITGITGSTGAGAKPIATTHFSWRNDNISAYKTFSHQHLSEIKETVNFLQEGDKKILFLPHRGNFSRGIFVTAYTTYNGSAEDAIAMYQSFYKNAAFVKISDQEIHLKQVVNTNFCLLQVQVKEGHIIVHSVLDNLLKGASGQAVQNMNLMMGWEETLGLKLKSNYY